MRAALLVVACLTGCYDPHVNRGAPCDLDSQCPQGQACIGGFCGGGDPSDIDGPMNNTDGPIAKDDPDGDGIASADDNCPTMANANQFNEDGDNFGDACDPCPVEANNAPSDPDNDGVADGCDPHPNVGGDHIAVFEGFGAQLPATWQLIGQTSVANGEITLTTVAGNHSAVVPPVGPLSNATLSALVVVDMQVGTADSASSISLPYDPQNDQGVFCEIYAPNAQSTNGRYVSLWDSPAQQERGMNQFAWTTGTAYRVSLSRTANAYACNVMQGTTSHVANGQTNSSPAPAKATFAVYGANARARWMMVVTSP